MQRSIRSVLIAKLVGNLFIFGATFTILRFIRPADMRRVPLTRAVIAVLTLSLAFAAVESWWALRRRAPRL